MAGLGKRFKNENFSTIKPLIVIDKKSIFEESIKDLPKSKNVIAIFSWFMIMSSFQKNWTKKCVHVFKGYYVP